MKETEAQSAILVYLALRGVLAILLNNKPIRIGEQSAILTQLRNRLSTPLT